MYPDTPRSKRDLSVTIITAVSQAACKDDEFLAIFSISQVKCLFELKKIRVRRPPE